MTIETFIHQLPDYAKDIKLNLSSVLTEAGAPGLTQKEIDAVAIASAYTTKNFNLIEALHQTVQDRLTASEKQAMQAAATIMAMNNVYYRFTHSVTDVSYQTLPAKLRMNVMANPGIEKSLFELASLAVSAINGCGMCMNAHAVALEKFGTSKESIQSAVRIASVINAAATGDAIRQ